jgi:hypothetical protein
MFVVVEFRIGEELPFKVGLSMVREIEGSAICTNEGVVVCGNGFNQISFLFNSYEDVLLSS